MKNILAETVQYKPENKNWAYQKPDYRSVPRPKVKVRDSKGHYVSFENWKAGIRANAAR